LNKPAGAFIPGSWQFIAMLAMMSAVVAFGVDVSLPAMALIKREFAASTDRVQLTLSAFVLALAVSQLVFGSLADRFGRKPILLTGLGIYTIAALGCSVASSIDQLVAFRALAGIGAAGCWILSRTIVRDLFEQRQGAQMLGHLTTTLMVIPLIAPTVGSWIMALFSWRAIFLFLALYGAAVFAMTWFRYAESIRERDLHAIRPGRIVRNYARFFRNPVCIGHAVVMTMIFAGMFCYISGSPFVLVEGFGVREANYGYYFAATALAMMAGFWSSAHLSRVWSAKRIIAFGTALTSVAAIVLFAGAVVDPRGLVGLALIVLPSMVYAYGMGVIQPNLIAVAMQPIPDMAGVGSAIMGSMQMAVAGLFGYAASLLYDGTPLAMASGMTVGGVGAGLLYLLLLRRQP